MITETKVKHVICPYCCHRFHPNEADFRLGAAADAVKTPEKAPKKNRKKPVAAAENGKTRDERLYAYNRDILLNDEAESHANALQFGFVSPAPSESTAWPEEDLTAFGFIRQLTYTTPSGRQILCEKRLCPHCHNELPIGYGMRETLLISVIGDARSGKSVFLTMLVAELENNPDMVSKLTYIGDARVRESFHEQYQKPLLRDHTLIGSTKRRKMPPFAFNYWYQYSDGEGAAKENAVDLIFYDIAGEDLRDDDAIRQNGFNIRNSSGLIFLADPTNFKRLGDLFRVSDAALIDAIPEDNSNRHIFDTLYNYFIGFEKDKSPIPFALTLSKSDLFRYVGFDFFANKPENRIQHLLDGENHRGALNMRCVKGLNYEVRELLAVLGEDALLNNALGCFKSVSCFALSSLGKKPTVEQISDPETNETVEKGYIEGPLAPFRVKEAFYWILMKNKLLYRHENNRYTLSGAEKETVKKQSLWERIAGFFTRRKRGAV